MGRTAIAVCTLVLLFSGPLSATTFRVPSLNYESIQVALGSATFGDTILVAPGGYDWNTDIENKPGITLRSEAGRESTTIYASGSTYATIKIKLSDGCRIEGFTVENTYGVVSRVVRKFG